MNFWPFSRGKYSLGAHLSYKNVVISFEFIVIEAMFSGLLLV